MNIEWKNKDMVGMQVESSHLTLCKKHTTLIENFEKK